MSHVNRDSVLAVGIIFPLLGLVSVILRTVARRSRKEGLGTDDWLCLPALALVIGCGATMIAGGVEKVLGSTNGEHFDLETQAVLEKLETCFYMLQVSALAFYRLSIVFFLRRLIPDRTFSIVSWIIVGIIITWLIMFISTVIACSTLRTRNDSGVHLASDLAITNAGNLLGALGVIDVIMNVAIVSMPLPVLRKLKWPTQRRVAAWGALLLGILAVACEIIAVTTFIRSQGLVDVATAPDKGIFGNADGAIASTIMFWGMMQTGLIAVAVSVPVIAPLVHYFPLVSFSGPSGTSQARSRYGGSRKGAWDGESCYSLEGIASLNPSTKNGLHLVEARVSTPVDSYKSRPVTPAPRTILVENKITQTVEIV